MERAGGVHRRPTCGRVPQMIQEYLTTQLAIYIKAECNLRERVRVGDEERRPLSEGLVAPNSIGTPSGMSASRPFGLR